MAPSIDRRILFHEDRISTFWVDQTDPNSLDALAAQLGDIKFDLIIDDGLHLPHANSEHPMRIAATAFEKRNTSHRGYPAQPARLRRPVAANGNPSANLRLILRAGEKRLRLRHTPHKIGVSK